MEPTATRYHYTVVIEGPIEMVRGGNRKRDVVINAERVLKYAEEKIRARPHEWMMFHPVWPQLLTE
jgi:lauroyl/myristoyl acyltransferase